MGYRGASQAIAGHDPHARSVIWAGSTTSDAVAIDAASSGLRLELPPGFAGSTISVLELTPAGDWAPVHAGGQLLESAVKTGAAGVNALVELGELLGLVDAKFVSDATETCVGNLRGCA